MSQPTTSRAVERLREATRDEHERTDRAVERRFFGSGEMGRSDYVDLLAAFLGLYRPLEEELARTDDLTGLANRREVQRRLQAEVEPARRYGS